MRKFPKILLLLLAGLLLIPGMSFASLLPPPGTVDFNHAAGSTFTDPAASLYYEIVAFTTDQALYKYELTNDNFYGGMDINRLAVPVTSAGLINAFWLDATGNITGNAADQFVPDGTAPAFGTNNSIQLIPGLFGPDVLQFDFSSRFGGLADDQSVWVGLLSDRLPVAGTFTIFDSGQPSLYQTADASGAGAAIGNRLNPVPEPGTLLLLGSGLLGLAGLRRRRMKA